MNEYPNSKPLRPLKIKERAVDPLLDAALAGIQRAWEDGRTKYPGDPWREKSIGEHLTHFLDHSANMGTVIPVMYDESVAKDGHVLYPLEEIDHALFRLAALRWKLTR